MGDKNNINVPVILDNRFSSIQITDGMKITCLSSSFPINSTTLLFSVCPVTLVYVVLYRVVVQTQGLSATIAAITV